MLQMILPEGSSSLLAFFGILFAFGATVLATAKLSPYCLRGNPEVPELFLSWHLWHPFCCFPL